MTVIDHVWQSTLFAIVAAMSTLLFRKNGAGVRFNLWFAASLKFLVPFSLLVAAGHRLHWNIPAPASHIVEWTSVVGQVAQPSSQLLFKVGNSALPPSAPVPAPVTSFDFARILWMVWAAGVAFFILRRALQVSRIFALARASRVAGYNLPISAKSSTEIWEPGLLGVFRPVLLLPEGIQSSLAPEQLSAVLAHELCHWRRHDNATALVHILVETLFWFHPMVWWIGARLIAEREQACDEAVIGAGHDPHAYAEGILKLCRMSVGRAPLYVAGVAGGSLSKRLEAIMTGLNPAKLSVAEKVLLTAAFSMVVVGPAAWGMTAVQERAASTSSEDPGVAYDRTEGHQLEVGTPQGFDVGKMLRVLIVDAGPTWALYQVVFAEVVEKLPNHTLKISGRKVFDADGVVHAISVQGTIRAEDILLPDRIKSDVIDQAKMCFGSKANECQIPSSPVAAEQDSAKVHVMDIADFKGTPVKMLVGYGLVFGLHGTGDTVDSEKVTSQALLGMLERLGIEAHPPFWLGGNFSFRPKEVAAVMVTASLPVLPDPGSHIDVTVKPIGDSTSLTGGTLVPIGMFAATGEVYAVALGQISSGINTSNAAAPMTAQGWAASGLICSGAPVSVGRPGHVIVSGSNCVRL